jgi:ribonuclease HI
MLQVRFLQVNLQHSKAASAALCEFINNKHIDVALIQEPWVYKGGVCGLGSINCQLLAARLGDQSPRASILIKNEFQAMFLPQFSSRDTVSARLTYRNDSGADREILICSAYFPIDSETPPPNREVAALVEYSNNNRIPLIIGCDANAHHYVWGSADVNARGEEVLQFITANQLLSLNVGVEPTFVTSVRQTVIDVTMCSESVGGVIEDWHVSKEASMSDHRYVRFNLLGSKPLAKRFKNPRKTNWIMYEELLRIGLQDTKKTVTNIRDLELVSSQVQDIILDSFNAACPISSPRRSDQPPWWTPTLGAQRKAVNRLFNGAKLSGAWLPYKEALYDYKRAIRKAKRKSWRTHCQEIETLSHSARLNKVLARGPPIKVGSLIQENGQYTQDAKEALGLLMETHFPGSRVIDSEREREMEGLSPTTRIPTENWKTTKDVVTYNRVQWAIRSFEPYKTPGPDNIYPALLQQGLEQLTPHLYRLFRASIALGHIPTCWRSVEVVFIPKAGRVSYVHAKDFRPISLSSFQLKALEKLIDRHIRDCVLNARPLHPMQFAYQAGKSTESALHCLVGRLERALETHQTVLATFLDIQGAFDNTSFASIAGAAAERGVDRIHVKWIESMLRSRQIRSKLYNCSLEVFAMKGCPQGGVLSPLLWCLVVDDLLWKLNNLGLHTQGYADDLVTSIMGVDHGTISELMQRALRIIEKWCNEHCLSVNPDKTVIVPFTTKRKLEKLRAPKLYGKKLEFTSSVKYLGVWLDAKLTWNKHLEHVTKKATMLMHMCRRAYGQTWGLRPGVVHWLYTAVIRPVIAYGSLVWWPKGLQTTAQQKLTKIQRLACLGITGAMKTTPTAALEALLDLPPLHLYVEGQARLTAHRMRVGEDKTITNFQRHNGAFAPLVGTNMSLQRTDRMPVKYIFTKSFRVVLPNDPSWEGYQKYHTGTDFKEKVWYTDGSKINASTGAGVCGVAPRVRLGFSLGRHASVFQAELYALMKCAEIVTRAGWQSQRVIIFSDSQAALKALDSYRVDSWLVNECRQSMELAATNNQVKLVWVRGHSGIDGNEKADQVAKKAAQRPYLGPEPVLSVPWAQTRADLKGWLREQHQRFWIERPGMRQSRQFITEPSKRASEELLRLNRMQIRAVVGLLTGHALLKRHLALIGVIQNDTMCRLCSLEQETAYHVLCECEALATMRMQQLGMAFPTPEFITTTTKGRLAGFILNTNMLSTEER